MPRAAKTSVSTHARFDRELKRLRADSLDRNPVFANALAFCSNDYLGLARNPALIEAAVEALHSADRVASTGPRLLSGNAAEWESLEEEFAEFVNTDSALYFGSGYAANVGLLSAVPRPEDTIYSDALNHASLIDGIRLSRSRKVVFPHLDLDFLEAALAQDTNRGEKFIVVESLFSMEGDRAPMDDLARLAERYGAGLIVDEAHAAGVLGPAGRGLIPSALRSSDLLVAAVYTCGKALASPGAFVTGRRLLTEFLINRARTFIFSTALPPHIAGQVSAALKLAAGADRARQRLARQAARLRDNLAGRGVGTGNSDAQIIPVILGSNENAVDATRQLQSAGFRIQPIRPPTVPEGTARLRLSVTADTPTPEIDKLTDAIAGLELQ